MGTIIDSVVFSSEIRAFSTSAANSTSVLKANAGEQIRANIQFRATIETRANAANGGTFTVTLISGATHSITIDNANFITDGWRVGDVFTLTDNAGGGIGVAAGQTILVVQGNYMEITAVAPLVAGTYANADMQLTTELTTLRFNYNFTPVSLRTDLVQQLIQSIQGFQYTNLVSVGAFQTGAAYVPNRGNTGTSQAKRLAATASFEQFFEIEHDFIVLPSGNDPEFTNLETLSAPEPYKTETVTYGHDIELGVGSDNLTLRPLVLDRLGNDSVGWRNENFNGGVNDFVLDSVAYADVATGDALTTIEAKGVTEVTAVISRVSGTFVTTDSTVVHHSYLPTEVAYQNSLTDYQTTWVYESLQNDIDAAGASGTIITNYTATLLANVLTVTFHIQYTVAQLGFIFDDGAFELYIALEEAALTADASNKVNLKIDAKRLTKSSDDTTLLTIPTLEFYNHLTPFTLGVTTGNTSVEMWIEEGILVAGGFSIATAPDITEVTKIDVQVIAENTITGNIFVLNSDIIPTVTQAIIDQSGDNVQLLQLDSTRALQLQAGDQFNFLKLQTGTWAANVQPYTYQIGIKMPWQDWISVPEVDSVFFDATKPNNNLNKKASNYSDLSNYVIKVRAVIDVTKLGIITTHNILSPAFKVFDYEKDRNVTPDYTGNIALTDKNSNALGANIIQNEDNTVTATFDDGSTKVDVADFEAITRLQIKSQGTDESIHEISSTNGVLTGDILKPLAGETNLKKTIVLGDYTAACLIDGLQLLNTDYSISSRLYQIAFSNFSMEFDGVNESVGHGSPASLNFDRTQAHSLSIWFKLNGINKNQRLADKSNSGAVGRGYSFFIRSSNLISYGLTSDASASPNPDQIAVNGSTVLTLDGLWHNFTVTYDGSSTAAGVLLYLDGVLETPSVLQDALVSTTQAVAQFHFGIRASGSSLPLDGRLNSGAAWDIALTPTQVMEVSSTPLVNLATHSAAANLQLYNKMGDGATFNTPAAGEWTFPDDSGNGLTGTSVNMEVEDRKVDQP